MKMPGFYSGFFGLFSQPGFQGFNTLLTLASPLLTHAFPGGGLSYSQSLAEGEVHESG
jgi:hypothetical protein